MKFENLFQPIRVGNLQLKNRIVMVSMSFGYRDEEGKPTERLKKFLAARAKGGSGLILTTLSPFYGPSKITPNLIDDSYIPVWRAVVDEVHAGGAKIGAQLGIPSVWAKTKDAKPELVGPSVVSVRPRGELPRALTVEEIRYIVEMYGDTARRVKEAGFDCIETNAGIGGVINQFISPASNKRQDDYGGSLENRMRFLLELIANVKKKAGEDFPQICKMCGDDFIEGGCDVACAKQVAVILEKAGINLLNVQPGWHDSPVPLAQKEIPPGYWAYLSEAIKTAVKIPVMVHYRFNSVEVAEKTLAKGQADLIGMGRAHIADPEFANKAKEGRLDDIRRCICCGRCMDQCVAWDLPLDFCSVNAQIGVDFDIPVEPAREPKEICIVGGGPAGMEAARVAALRGHHVTLIEKGPRLGGALLVGSILRSENGDLLAYLTKQLAKLKVKVKLRQEVTAKLLEQLKPDIVILALGGTSIDPGISGSNGDNVLTFSTIAQLLSGRSPKGGPVQKVFWRLGSLYFRFFYSPALLRRFLKFGFPFGKRVVIIGGGFAGCELAETLVEKGRKVAIVEVSKRMAFDVGPSERFIVMKKFKESGTRLETDAKVLQIDKNSVKIIRGGEEVLLEADTVVITLGMKPNTELARQLQDKFPFVYTIGDSAEPKRIAEAIKSGFRRARDV